MFWKVVNVNKQLLLLQSMILFFYFNALCRWYDSGKPQKPFFSKVQMLEINHGNRKLKHKKGQLPLVNLLFGGKFSTCLLPKLHWTIRVKDFVRLTRSVQREKLYPPVHANFPTIGALYLHWKTSWKNLAVFTEKKVSIENRMVGSYLSRNCSLFLETNTRFPDKFRWPDSMQTQPFVSGLE